MSCNLPELLAPGNGGHDAHFIGFLDRCGVVLEETDVFIIDEDIHETAHITRIVADAFIDAGEGLVEAGEDFADV